MAYMVDEYGLISDPTFIALAVGFAKAWWTDHRGMMIAAGVPTVSWDELPDHRKMGYADMAALKILRERGTT